MVVQKLDPYVPRSVPVRISSLVDLRRKAELFRLAHTMVRVACVRIIAFLCCALYCTVCVFGWCACV